VDTMCSKEKSKKIQGNNSLQGPQTSGQKPRNVVESPSLEMCKIWMFKTLKSLVKLHSGPALSR